MNSTRQDMSSEIEKALKGFEALLKEISRRVEGLEARFRPTPTCITRKEAARLLGVSSSTLKRMIATGEILTTSKKGRAPIPMSEVERLATPDEKRPAQQKAAKKAAWVPLKKKR